jgi:phosphoglycerate dehydrogenase-like enzyme
VPQTRIVLHPRHPYGIGDFLSSVPDIVLDRPSDDDGVAEALQDGAEVLATYTWREDFLSPSLRWVAGLGAGYEQYPIERLADEGVVLTTAAGIHSAAVAEHAFALLLSLTRRIGESVRHMSEPRWVPLLGEELAGKKMAIIGLGRIGEAIASRARNWEMMVAGSKRNPESYSGCVSDVRGPGDLGALCAWADIVVLTTPANADGTAVIGARELELLGEGWLVNVGRGTLVDPDALLSAVTKGRLKGVALDVTSPEPLPEDSPLWKSPKVVVSAHNAAASPNLAARWGKIFHQNLLAYHDRGSWKNRLTPMP